jgi:hypothetical protein
VRRKGEGNLEEEAEVEVLFGSFRGVRGTTDI